MVHIIRWLVCYAGDVQSVTRGYRMVVLEPSFMKHGVHTGYQSFVTAMYIADLNYCIVTTARLQGSKSKSTPLKTESEPLLTPLQ